MLGDATQNIGNHALGSTPLSFSIWIRVQTMAAVEVAVLAVTKQVGLRRITSGELLKQQKGFCFSGS